MGSGNNDIVRAVAATREYIGGRWKTVILYYLTTGKRRFGEIAARMPTISKKVLTEQPKELEKDGLIDRVEYKEKLPRVASSLTEQGQSFSGVFREISSWIKKTSSAKTKKHLLTMPHQIIARTLQSYKKRVPCLQ